MSEPTGTVGSRGTAPRALIALIVLLAALVGAQSLILFKLYKRVDGRSEPSAKVVSVAPMPSAVILPHSRKPAPAPPNTSAPPPAPDPAAQAFENFFDRWNADRWDPFEEIQHMRQQMDRLLGNAAQFFQGAPTVSDDWSAFPVRPDLDLHEDADRYVIRMDIPGSDKSKINISVEDRVLTVAGSIDDAVDQNDNGRAIRSERRHGQFQRSISLPGPVDADKMEARYENGVLVVTIPKSEEGLKKRQVPVA
jgi:HSP20 family protein